MKMYKKELLEGFIDRNFEFSQIEITNKELHWWLEDKWTLKRSFNDKAKLVIQKCNIKEE